MITIKKHSGIYTLISKQQLPIGIEVAWDFFSTPENLAKITPDKMSFDVTSEYSPKVYQGQIITYKIGVLPGKVTNWVTEITHMVEQKYFVDEQRFGPYKMWHHEHFFEKNDLGVMMIDKVSYKIPFGLIGRMANKFFIEKQLRNIFSYRYNKLNELFG